MNINVIQADIIFKGMYHTCHREGITIPEDLQNVYGVLAEENPNKTHIEDSIDIMVQLAEMIKVSEPYADYFPEYVFSPIRTGDGATFYGVYLGGKFVCHMENRDIAQVDRHLESIMGYETRQDFLDSFE